MSDETKTETKPSKKKTASAPKKVLTPISRERVYRFEQWAARRQIPTHHLGGLKAYVKNVHKPRTLEEWDKCFKDY